MKSSHPVLNELEFEPLAPEQVVAGDPIPADLTLFEDAENGGGTAGIWSCSPGRFADVEVAEAFLVLAGEATIRYEDGREFELRSGTVHTFEGGERTVWEVRIPLLKTYWLR